ncbi:hypothetical protein [Microbulbifer sp. VAAF005]|uniref:hypothetical protein n=1 Tax=Microbulbifer sp. VAAF005 TaxID=3034230 RepID=UPI0024ADA932|nr:hypothetical protein [Microbulbifer sp. VAAF005]WHI47520.1 hypothetical protein P0078_03790 [Microbulbifer sp. VAAF005]
MAKDILAAMIEFDDSSKFMGVSNANFSVFEGAVVRAKAMMQDYPDDKYIKMLVAPEYYFSGYSSKAVTNHIDSLSKSSKSDIYSGLRRVSRQYPNILIVAGTIAYTKGGGCCFSSTSYLSIAPILAGGNFLLKKYKVGNDQYQTADAFATKQSDSTFTYKGLTFGIDICLDHNNKILKKSLDGKSVDVHILISDGSSPTPNSLATNKNGGGAVVFCNMRSINKGKGVNGIMSVSPNKFGNLNVNVDSRTQVAKTGQTLAGGFHIALYSGQA